MRNFNNKNLFQEYGQTPERRCFSAQYLDKHESKTEGSFVHKREVRNKHTVKRKIRSNWQCLLMSVGLSNFKSGAQSFFF